MFKTMLEGEELQQAQAFCSAIAGELRRRGEKRIKSVFYEPDGSLTVFLKGDLVIGKKSFQVSPQMMEVLARGEVTMSIEKIVSLLLEHMEKEVLTRSDVEVERHASVPEEEYEYEQNYQGD